MLIIDALRSAGTAQEVCYLLTNYVETLQFYDMPRQLPAGFTALPVRGLDDIAARLADLQAVRHGPDARLASHGHNAMIDEAINLFGAAVHRLGALGRADAAHYTFDRRANARVHGNALRL